MAIAINGAGTITGITAGGLPDASIVADDIAANAVTTAKINADAVTTAKINADAIDGTKLADNAVNSEHMTAGSVDNAHLATGISASKLTGALPAISGASLTNLPAGGDTRNFIIDGDFTQWPEGTAFPNIAHNVNGAALWEHNGIAGYLGVNRSTSVPTIAQSGHQSAYSLEMDCTTAHTPASGDYQEFRYYMTGSDFTFIHQQTVTLAFWWYSTVTGTCSGCIRNSAQNRTYPYTFTVSASNTWEYKTITIPLDTSGTWLFTEADKGCLVTFSLNAGSGQTATANTWGGAYASGATGTANHTSSTSNYVRIAQVGLYLGSTAPTFLAEPIATVLNQVEYYVQRYNYDGDGTDIIAVGYVINSGTKLFGFMSRNPTRVNPTVTYSAADTFLVTDSGGAVAVTGFNIGSITKQGFRAQNSTASGLSTGHGALWRRDGTDTTFVMLDARH